MSRNNSFTRKLLLAGIVAAGTGAFWYMAVMWAIGTAQQAFRAQKPYESIHVTVTGEPVLVRMSDLNSQNTEKILSLDREPVALTTQDLLQPMPLNAETPYYNYLPQWYTRIVGINDGGVPATYWYLVHDGRLNGLAYGVGFHASTKTIHGYFGKSGFTESLPPRSDWFRVPGTTGMYGKVNFYGYGQEPRWSSGQSSFLLLAEGKLWKIDLVNKQITAFLDSPSGAVTGPVYRLLESPPLAKDQTGFYSAQSMTPMDAGVRESEALTIINLQTGQEARYPLAADLRDKQLSVVRLANGQLLLIASKDWRSADQEVIWLAASGEVARRETVHIESQYTPISWASRGWQSAFAGPAPLYSAVYSLVAAPQQAISEGEAADFSRALRMVVSQTWPSMIAVLVAGIVCAVMAYRRQRRFGLSNAGAWAAFAFLFGVPGWIAYRNHRTWPVIEDCPSCRQPSPRDRERCVDCGASFPGPELKGIEVFA